MMKFRAFLLAIAALVPVGALAQGVIPTNNAAIFSAQPVIAQGATTARSLASRAADVMKAADWGVVCDGSTDNSAAISNMMANEPATGADIIFPPGTCVLGTGTINIIISGTTIEGASGAETTELARSAASLSSLINLGKNSSGDFPSGVIVKNLTLTETGSASSTDYAIYDAGSFNIYSNIKISNFGIGINSNSVESLIQNNNIVLTNSINGAIGIQVNGPGGQNVIYNNTITGTNSSTETSIGIEVTAGSANEFIFNELEALGTAMNISPPTGGGVYSTIIISNWFDHPENDGLLLNGTSAPIQRITIDDSWFGSSYTGDGMEVEGTVEGAHISNSEFYLNHGNGIGIDNSASIQSFILYGSFLGANGLSGISVGNDVSNFSFIGNVMGPTAGLAGNEYPYFIAGPTNNNFLIEGNNTSGNTNPPFNGSTSTTGIIIVGNSDSLGNILNGSLTINGIAVGVTPSVATLATNPPVSGTAYQWAGPGTLQLACPITYSPTSTAAATNTLDIGSTSTPSSAVDTESEPAGITAGMIHTAHAEVPAGWYYELSATNATIGTCVGVVH